MLNATSQWWWVIVLLNCVGEKLGNPRKGIQEMVNRCNLAQNKKSGCSVHESTWYHQPVMFKGAWTQKKSKEWTISLILLPCSSPLPSNLLKFICHSERARTDSWIQNSRLFSCFFSKQYFLFPDSRLSNRWLIETLKKKEATKPFSYSANVGMRFHLTL